MKPINLHKLGSGTSSDRKPMEVIKDFFREMGVEDLRETLEDFLFVALTTENLQFETGLQRDAAIHTIRQLLDLVTAAEQLTKKKGNG